MNIETNNIIKKYSALKSDAGKFLSNKYNKDIPKIYIGMSTCCLAAGSLDTKTAFENILKKREVLADIIPVGCLGHCYTEPFVIVKKTNFPPIFYYEVTPSIARLIVTSFLENDDPLFEYLLGSMEPNDMIPAVADFPRFNMEERIIMNLCGRINPGEIYEYIYNDGYSSLVKALSMDRTDIINSIKASGLRGRGGAGFTTGIKMEMLLDSSELNSSKELSSSNVSNNSNENDRFVICNADEGDPGAYMDRTILESNPHQLLEGLAISAIATGAERGIIYVRSEYPLAVETLKKAIAQAYELNLLGEKILGTRFNFDVTVFQGSGAFVCGEETALINSLEGARGMPEYRPPYPVERGLYNKPTLINNVKTLSYIPHIIKDDGKNFGNTGTKDSPGTAIFSIVGDVVHAGLVEIPMGVTIRSLVFDICGGIPGHKKFKAIQIGGPSGGCLDETCLDTSIDFESLSQAGAMMGSGGLVVMNGDSCMVDVAKYFLEFTQNESCGKCTFCRIGTKHILNILDRLTKGEGREGDTEMLEELCLDVKDGSLCGLGKTAPNPVLTSLKYFRGEYEAHLNEKRCPALKCRSLTAYYIDLEKCARGCDACVGSCPVEAIFTTKNRRKAIDQSLCVKCGECMTACPAEYDAVKKVSPSGLAPVIERPKTEEKSE